MIFLENNNLEIRKIRLDEIIFNNKKISFIEEKNENEFYLEKLFENKTELMGFVVVNEKNNYEIVYGKKKITHLVLSIITIIDLMDYEIKEPIKKNYLFYFDTINAEYHPKFINDYNFNCSLFKMFHSKNQEYKKTVDYINEKFQNKRTDELLKYLKIIENFLFIEIKTNNKEFALNIAKEHLK